MSWRPFSLHFKQVYDGGYRYLDRCGDFMIAAERELSLMSEDAKPTGAKLALPEKGVGVTLDSTELTVVQELHHDRGVEFIEICSGLVRLVEEFFQPSTVESNGFASKTFQPMPSSDAALEASLKSGSGLAADLAKLVNMPARQDAVDCHFAAGNSDLHLRVRAVTFNSITVQRYAAGPRATAAQRRRIERLNQKAERLDRALSHAVMMEVDLIEFQPPPKPLEEHFLRVMDTEKKLQKRFSEQ